MAIRKLKKITPVEHSKILEKLKELMERHEEVLFAFLYGSFVEGDFPYFCSDIDLAIYVDSQRVKEPAYVFEAQIEMEIYKELFPIGLYLVSIEALVINHAPYQFQVSILKQPYLMVKENEEIFTDFIEEASGRACAEGYIRRESLKEFLET